MTRRSERPLSDPQADPPDGRLADWTSHLDAANWTVVNRQLVRKAICEFAHEGLLAPQPTGAEGEYELRAGSGATVYRFRARPLALRHLLLDPASLACERQGRARAVEAEAFIRDFAAELGLSARVLPVYLAEIASILQADAWKRRHRPHRARDLAFAGFQEIEQHMSEGHPVFVANSGRLGFGMGDYRRYAPEAAAPLSILWVAVRRERTVFAVLPGLDRDGPDYPGPGPDERGGLEAALSARGLDPSHYRLLPVHPWQWENRILPAFPGAVARRDIVPAGLSRDLYRPQQSIRTFFNLSQPGHFYVKMALSILNMGFELGRGLGAEDIAATPLVNDWVRRELAGDPLLAAAGFTLICEVAAAGYVDRPDGGADGAMAPREGVLAAVWRESPVALLGEGERLMTMAALLHRDPQGAPLIGALIEAAGISAGDWLGRYFDHYLVPLVHCCLAHGLVFMPHGENVILVLKAHLPVRIVLKDIAEELRVLRDRPGMPDAVRAKLAPADGALFLDGIFTDIMDCFLRPLSALLEETGLLDHRTFWRIAARRLRTYRDSRPDLAEAFSRHDLFAPDFAHNCINRLQLRDNRKLIEAGNPDRGFVFAGRLQNPLAGDASPTEE